MDSTSKEPNGPRSRPKAGRWRKSKKKLNHGTLDQDAKALSSLMKNTSIGDNPSASTTGPTMRKGPWRPRQRKQKAKALNPISISALGTAEHSHSLVNSGEIDIEEPESPVEIKSQDSEDEAGHEDGPEKEDQVIRDYIMQISANAGPSFLGVNLSGKPNDETAIDSWEWSRVDPIEEPPKRSKRKQKGNWAQPPHVSDPELQEKLENSWKNDRLAKSRRKKEREALRHQGLLQVKKEGLLDELYDVRSVYQDGLQLLDLRRELANLCQSSSYSSLALPPTNPSARRAIHLLIHKLDLKSKSHGMGNDRYMVISKPPDVEPLWNEKTFDRLVKGLNLLHILKPSPDTKEDTWESYDPLKDDGSWSKEQPKRAGALKAKGWMEKMGWTEGQGLGSISNKGILDPIQIQLRSSRGGLGWEG